MDPIAVAQSGTSARRTETQPLASAPPVISPIQRTLEAIYEKVRAEPLQGKVADYIPELVKADPHAFEIAAVTTDGQVYTVGDVEQTFTIQSISKPFVYGFVLEAYGVEDTLAKVGVEPSGEAFNSISLYPDSGRPFNPMINAGAIACAGMFQALHGERAIERVLQRFSRLADRKLQLDDAVCRSERSTGHRNRAIAHLLRNFEILTDDDVEQALATYFAQCSISINCCDLAMMGATLANHGRNPRSGQTALASEHVHRVLSVMSSCGVYDYSGEWGHRVGLPAKSGVGGGILAVLPGQLSIAVFSPPLDERGNSARGIRVCEELARSFQLHMLHTPRVGSGVIRKDISARELRSWRVRRPEREQLLEQHGHAIRIVYAQGDLSFSSVEVLTRKLTNGDPQASYVLLDLQRVAGIDETAVSLLMALCDGFERAGKKLVVCHSRHLEALHQAFLARPYSELLCVAEDTAAMLDECEEELLAELDTQATEVGEVSLKQQQLTTGMTASELAALERQLVRRVYRPNDLIVKEGDPALELFFVGQGQVSVLLGDPRRPTTTLARIGAGLCFGEMAMIEQSAQRSASIRADLPTTCWVLPYAALEAPELAGVRHRLVANIASNLAARLRKANAEIRNLM